MTQEQKISILLRKYGSKSVLSSFSQSPTGDASSWAAPGVLTSQIYSDLASLPFGTNPLKKSPVNLSVWPNASSPVIRKIIKKPLTWIKGTNVFYDPTDPSNEDAVVDVISPVHDASFAPEVYVLNSRSNRYLDRISPSLCPWTFDYETGCLVFTQGLPKSMKAPQFQPPAITCYRYTGVKNATGISPRLVQGPEGPIGPTGVQGATYPYSMLWKGDYSPTSTYAVNDVVNSSGIIYVKHAGPTGPTDITSAYFDSISYNELVDGFVPSLCEQFIDVSYASSDAPYFDSLQTLFDAITSPPPGGIGPLLKTCDQNINVFDSAYDCYYTSAAQEPISTRIFFNDPRRMEEVGNYAISGPGRKVLLVDGLYANNTTISSTAGLYIDNCAIIAPLSSSFVVNYYANSSTILASARDVTFTTRSSFYQGSQLAFFGKSHVSSSTLHECVVFLGDQTLNTQSLATQQYRDRVLHYFEDVEFIDTEFIMSYSGRYSDVELVFNRCKFNDSRAANGSSGITFPVRPYEFDVSNPLRYRPKITIIDSCFTCEASIFNLPDYTDMYLHGTVVIPSILGQPQDLVIETFGTVTSDSTLSRFMSMQYTSSSISPRACSSFYYNK